MIAFLIGIVVGIVATIVVDWIHRHDEPPT